MSGGVYANPQEIRKFASSLRKFNQNLENNISYIKNDFARLGETWKDKKHQKFAAEFLQIIKAIRKFEKISEQQIPELLKSAELLEKFLETK